MLKACDILLPTSFSIITPSDLSTLHSVSVSLIRSEVNVQENHSMGCYFSIHVYLFL